MSSAVKMPLSRTHPFSVPSSNSYIQDTEVSLPSAKMKEQSPPAVTSGSAVLPEVQSICNVHCMNAANYVCLQPHAAQVMGRPIRGRSSLGDLPPSNGQPQQQTDKPKTMVVTPEQVMKHYVAKLTPYEHQEIFQYPQIYFLGVNAKKRPGNLGNPNNCDYDNEQGSYIHIPHDHIAYRYEVLKVIGKGSFGQVVKAYDHKAHTHVALKIVRNEKRFHRQAQEEIRILEHLRKQDKNNTMNIVHMLDSFTFRNHMCITFELLSINLYELIKKNKFQGFSLQLVRKFCHSLLQCLDALNRNKIIHCDMKPENVLLKQQGRSGLKVSTLLLQ